MDHLVEAAISGLFILALCLWAHQLAKKTDWGVRGSHNFHFGGVFLVWILPALGTALALILTTTCACADQHVRQALTGVNSDLGWYLPQHLKLLYMLPFLPLAVHVIALKGLKLRLDLTILGLVIIAMVAEVPGVAFFLGFLMLVVLWVDLHLHVESEKKRARQRCRLSVTLP